MRAARRLAGSGEWLVVAAQLLLVVVLLGPPDVAAASRYFQGQLPTERATLALAEIVVWVVAVALTLGWLGMGVRRLRTQRAAAPRAGWVVAVVLGLSLLGAGLVHHLGAAGYGQCCGSLVTAQQLVTVAPGGARP